MYSLSKKDWFLLALLTFSWGLNWPIMKYAVTHMPPVSFRVLGMLASLPVMWLVARIHDESIALKKEQIWPVIKLSMPNILIWNTLMILGVQMLSSGRSAILSYTMPIWATLFAWLLMKEKLSKMALFGISCAGLGAFFLLSSEFSALSSQPEGVIIILIGAACWGYGTVRLKQKQLPVTTSALTFWMVAFSCIGMVMIALFFEAHSWHTPNPLEIGAIVYNAVFVFGISTIVWNKMARNLPPVVSGISVMMVPVVGVFSGILFLSETPHWQDYAAMILIVLSMSAVLLNSGSATRK